MYEESKNKNHLNTISGGSRKPRLSKEDLTYGVFNEYSTYNRFSEPEQNEDKDDIVMRMLQQKQPNLNFFQPEFSQTQFKQSTTAASQLMDERQAQINEYHRGHAFMNFRKAKINLEANVSDGIRVLYPDQQQQQNVEEPKQAKKIKSVNFALERNSVHKFVKDPAEFLTAQEKQQLVQNIYRYRFGWNGDQFDPFGEEEIEFEQEEDEDDEDDSESQEQSIFSKSFSQLNQVKPGKSILKKRVDETEVIIKTEEEQRQKRVFEFQKLSLAKKTEVKEEKMQQRAKQPKKQPKNLKRKEQELENVYDKGFEMIKKLGFKVGDGLGKDKQGILNPIQHEKKTEFKGGSDPLADLGIYAEYSDEMITDLIESKYEKTGEVDKKLQNIYKLEKLWRKNNPDNRLSQIRQKVEQERREKQMKDEKQMNLNKQSILENLIKGEKGLKQIKEQIEDNSDNEQMEELKIIDMRDGDMKIYNNFDQMIKQNQINMTLEPNDSVVYASQKENYNQPLSELQLINWNLNNLINKNESKLERLLDNIKSEKDKIVIWEHEIKETQIKFENAQQKNKNRQIFYEQIANLSELVEELSTMEFLQRLKKIFDHHQHSFTQFNIQSLLVKQITIKIEKQLLEWEGPSSNESMLIEEFDIISFTLRFLVDVFTFQKSESLQKYTQNQKYHEEYQIKNDKMSNDDLRLLRRYQGYMNKQILTKLRTFIINNWIPELEQDFYLLDFIEKWSEPIISVQLDDDNDIMKTPLAAFSNEQQLEIMDQLIIPKLEQAITNWQNISISQINFFRTFSKSMSESEYLHIWLRPWLTQIKDKKKSSELIKMISLKLSATFQNWQTHNEWGIKLLIPWQHYLEKPQWENLLLRVIIPKLLFMMTTDFKVNPAHQDIKPIKIINDWADYLQNDHLNIILESTLFAQLQQVLNVWLKHNGNKMEIQIWLEGWQNLIQKKILNKVDHLQNTFDSLKNAVNS